MRFSNRTAAVFSILLLLEHTAEAYPRVVTVSPSIVESYAASQLEAYLGNMSALTGNAETTKNDAVIAVGYHAAIQLIDSSELVGLGNDSFVMSSNKAGIPSGSYVISGGANATRGSLFGVYEFLR